jgi:hypothetical protein
MTKYILDNELTRQWRREDRVAAAWARVAVIILRKLAQGPESPMTDDLLKAMAEFIEIFSQRKRNRLIRRALQSPCWISTTARTSTSIGSCVDH